MFMMLSPMKPLLLISALVASSDIKVLQARNDTFFLIPSFKRALNNRLVSIFEVFVVLLLAFVGSKVT